jgi:hypothetical protein
MAPISSGRLCLWGLLGVSAFADAYENQRESPEVGGVATISGDDLHALIREAKEKGVTVASLVHKLPGNVGVQTVVSPGPGAVDPAPRTPIRGKNS